jgi:hypothetical protein
MSGIKCDVVAIVLVFLGGFGEASVSAEQAVPPAIRGWRGNDPRTIKLIPPNPKSDGERGKASTEQGKLAVITQPAGAKVRIDRFDQPALAKTPTVLRVPAGEHMVQIKLSGYKTVHRVVVISASRVTMLKMKLKKDK